ncbi:MAG TPA: hypothetical protein VN257_11260, partial [Actinotalea sp.]|nr:hypothetical protein [Actinotalea sp.]
ETWLGHLGGASIDVCYQVTTPTGPAPTSRTTGPRSPAGGEPDEPGPGSPPGGWDPVGRQVHVQARTTLVLVDAASGRPRRISPEERAVWLPYLGAPVSLRRRRP